MYGYKRMNFKEYKRFLKYFKQIKHVQQYIKKYLIGNIRYYFYSEDNSIKILKLRFTVGNFMHLCGVRYYKRSAKEFWRDILHKRLKISNVLIKRDGSTFQKLQIINCLTQLGQLNLRITNGSVITRLHLHYNKSIKTSKKIMELALGRDNKDYYPKSLLNLKRIKNYKRKSFKVLAIFDKNIKNGGIIPICRTKGINYNKYLQENRKN